MHCFSQVCTNCQWTHRVEKVGRFKQFSCFPLDSKNPDTVKEVPHRCRSGETGRRTGLKIQRGQPHVSSILTSGTIQKSIQVPQVLESLAGPVFFQSPATSLIKVFRHPTAPFRAGYLVRSTDEYQRDGIVKYAILDTALSGCTEHAYPKKAVKPPARCLTRNSGSRAGKGAGPQYADRRPCPQGWLPCLW